MKSKFEKDNNKNNLFLIFEIVHGLLYKCAALPSKKKYDRCRI